MGVISHSRKWDTTFWNCTIDFQNWRKFIDVINVIDAINFLKEDKINKIVSISAMNSLFKLKLSGDWDALSLQEFPSFGAWGDTQIFASRYYVSEPQVLKHLVFSRISFFSSKNISKRNGNSTRNFPHRKKDYAQILLSIYIYRTILRKEQSPTFS